MSFLNLGTLNLEPFRPGIMSKAQIGSNLIMVCMQIDQGKEDTGHEHPFDQWERRILNANECYFIPAGQRHGWKTFDQPVKILDVSQ